MVILEAAKKYLATGLPVIPCRLTATKDGRVDKRPCISWRQFQTKLPNEAQLTTWWSAYPDAHVGVVTGGTAGVFAIDCDVGFDPQDLADLGVPPTRTSRTPSGGRHYFLRHPGGIKIKTVAGFRHKIDVRGDGGFIVLPPSSYPDGRPYTWIDTAPIADAPPTLLALVEDKADKNGTHKRQDLTGVIKGAAEGQRSQSAVQVAGLLLRFMPQDYWHGEVWHLLRLWNAQNVPPLDEQELLANFRSIVKTEQARRRAYMEAKEQQNIRDVNTKT